MSNPDSRWEINVQLKDPDRIEGTARISLTYNQYFYTGCMLSRDDFDKVLSISNKHSFRQSAEGLETGNFGFWFACILRAFEKTNRTDDSKWVPPEARTLAKAYYATKAVPINTAHADDITKETRNGILGGGG